MVQREDTLGVGQRMGHMRHMGLIIEVPRSICPISPTQSRQYNGHASQLAQVIKRNS